MSDTGAMVRAYARALEEARREFAGGLPEVMAQAAGSPFGRVPDGALGGAPGEPTAGSAGSFTLALLDLPLVVDFPGGRVSAAGEDADVGVLVVVLHYLARSVGPLDLSGAVRYAGLPGATAFAAAFRGRVEVPLLERFGEDEEGFLRAVSAVGGTESGGVWEVPFLPHLPLGIRLGLAEDLLPAECVVLFPRRAGFVYSVEDLAVAGQLLAARLLALAGEAGSAGAPPWSLPSLLAWSDVAEEDPGAVR